jgi:hypothetical protein
MRQLSIQPFGWLKLLLVVGVAGGVLLPGIAVAQTSRPVRTGEFAGHVGFVGEAYSASGITNRRDGTSGMVFGRGASQSSDVQYGFQFMLATEQTGSRQAMNRLSANVGYRFLGVTVGDLSPVLSGFSVNGATVRGGSAEVTYGPYVASFLYGRVRRSVDLTGSAVFGRPSFSEWLYSARIGAGQSDGSHVHLIGVVVRDDESSLADSINASPVENVSITPDLGLKLFDSRLHLRATYTLAAFSGNTRANAAESGVSSMMGFFTPRVGSRIDYATDISARLRLKEFKLRASYERVQPGFTSLGLSQTRSDQAVIRIEPSLSLAERRANLQLRFRSSRNNLAGNRASTLMRRQLSLYGHFRLSPRVNLAAAYSNMSTRNDLNESLSALSVADQRNVAQTIMVGPTFTIPSSTLTHVITLYTTYQFLRDKTPASDQSRVVEVKFDNLAATAAYSIAFANGFSLNSSAGMLSSKTPTTDAGALSITVGGSTSLLQRRARLSLGGGWSRNSLDFPAEDLASLTSRQLSLRFAGSYRLPTGSQIRLTTRGLRNSGDLTGSFNELQVSLRVEHRF